MQHRALGVEPHQHPSRMSTVALARPRRPRRLAGGGGALPDSQQRIELHQHQLGNGDIVAGGQVFQKDAGPVVEGAGPAEGEEQDIGVERRHRRRLVRSRSASTVRASTVRASRSSSAASRIASALSPRQPTVSDTGGRHGVEDGVTTGCRARNCSAARRMVSARDHSREAASRLMSRYSASGS